VTLLCTYSVAYPGDEGVGASPSPTGLGNNRQWSTFFADLEFHFIVDTAAVYTQSCKPTGEDRFIVLVAERGGAVGGSRGRPSPTWV